MYIDRTYIMYLAAPPPPPHPPAPLYVHIEYKPVSSPLYTWKDKILVLYINMGTYVP